VKIEKIVKIKNLFELIERFVGLLILVDVSTNYFLAVLLVRLYSICCFSCIILIV